MYDIFLYIFLITGAGLVVGVPSPSPPPPTVLPPSGARHGRGPVPPVTTPHIPPTTNN